MNKQNKTAGKTAKAMIARAIRRQAEFNARKAALTELKKYYPDALAAIDEYACSFISEGHRGRARRIACRIANDTACVSSTWRSFAADATKRMTVEGDQPGDAVPAEVVAGLVYLRFNAPRMFARLVAMDLALGACLPVQGGIFASSAILMRSALALAA